MQNMTNKHSFQDLLKIMKELREKCPWDREQTLESIRHLSIEEVYELSDAILSGNFQEIRKELGDILLHVVFYAEIASETQKFNIEDVIDGLCRKLIQRHPHIYGEVKAENAEQVKENWEKIKMKEGNKSVLAGVPGSLPALIKASRIQEKVKAVGFDWDHKDQVWDKVQEELMELQTEIKQNSPKDKIEGELGDVFFALVNYARFIGVNPEDALEKTNRKFMNRFKEMEMLIKNEEKDMTNMSLNELDVYWNQAKSKEKNL